MMLEFESYYRNLMNNTTSIENVLTNGKYNLITCDDLNTKIEEFKNIHKSDNGDNNIVAIDIHFNILKHLLEIIENRNDEIKSVKENIESSESTIKQLKEDNEGYKKEIEIIEKELGEGESIDEQFMI